jgi:hypothetical protein
MEGNSEAGKNKINLPKESSNERILWLHVVVVLVLNPLSKDVWIV